MSRKQEECVKESERQIESTKEKEQLTKTGETMETDIIVQQSATKHAVILFLFWAGEVNTYICEWESLTKPIT